MLLANNKENHLESVNCLKYCIRRLNLHVCSTLYRVNFVHIWTSTFVLDLFGVISTYAFKMCFVLERANALVWIWLTKTTKNKQMFRFLKCCIETVWQQHNKRQCNFVNFHYIRFLRVSSNCKLNKYLKIRHISHSILPQSVPM